MANLDMVGANLLEHQEVAEVGNASSEEVNRKDKRYAKDYGDEADTVTAL